MNKYQAKNLLPIIEAFAHGKQIQTIAQVTSDGKCMWVDTNEPHFETASRFRIKPERVYRPFQNAEECWEEMLKHQPFGWLKDKEDEAYVMVTKVSDGRDDMAINGNYNWRLDGLLEYFTFADGTPFGIKEG
jgi:hypothetical protein